MSEPTYAQLVLDALRRSAMPLTAREVLDQCDSIQDVDQAARVLYGLYKAGKVLRSQVDGRYCYQPSESAPFERVDPAEVAAAREKAVARLFPSLVPPAPTPAPTPAPAKVPVDPPKTAQKAAPGDPVLPLLIQSAQSSQQALDAYLDRHPDPALAGLVESAIVTQRNLASYRAQMEVR